MAAENDTQDPVVFIVDDDPAIRHALTLLVQSYGWHAAAFDSAEAFLAGSDLRRPGCLVLDLHMGGINGVELQEQLRRRGCALPVILITAHPDSPLTRRARRAGAACILSKPLQDNQLRRHIAAALAARG